jgi:hypothetical protein
LDWLVFAALVLASGCEARSESTESDPEPEPEPEPEEVPTYHGDVKRILDAKCVGCHADGGIAPFALETYEQARVWEQLVVLSVQMRTMPPWLAGTDCNEYVMDPSLGDEQIDLIARWVDAGSPEGDAGNPGPPLDAGPSHTLSRIDQTLALPEPYVASSEDDDYRCFVLDWPQAQPIHVTGFGVRPGDTRSVHHAIAFVVEPEDVPEVEALDAGEEVQGYSCYGGPLAPAAWLGVWTPGSVGADFPPGTGIRVEPGSKVVLQVHYSPHNGPPVPDVTAVDLRLDEEVQREAWIQPWFDPSWYGEGVMSIPAGAQHVSYSVSYDPTLFVTNGRPLVVHTAGLHMHALGTSGRLSIERKDGEDECLLDIPRWNFHWQGAYGFVEPKLVEPGDRIYLECHWDNSATNQPIVGGVRQEPRDVDWGEAASDEMCLGAFYMTLQ